MFITLCEATDIHPLLLHT